MLQTAAEKSAVEKAIENAKETCEQGNVGACAAAWDEVRSVTEQPPYEMPSGSPAAL